VFEARSLVVVAAAVLVGAGTVGSAAGVPKEAPAAPALVFVGHDNSGWGVYAGRPDGHGFQRLLTLRAGAGHTNPDFAWTPDGSAVAVGDTDGSRILEVPSGRTMQVGVWAMLSFSGDGRVLAMANMDNDNISVVDRLTGRKRLVLKGPHGVVASLAVSPTGDQIAYSIRGVLTVMGTNGKGLRTVFTSQSGAGPFDLHWSPDGTWIAAFDSSTKPAFPRGTLVLIPTSGGTPHRLLKISGANLGDVLGSGLAAGSLAWSPDSRRLAAICGSDLCVVRVDGTMSRVASAGSRSEIGGPVWSPDGSWIAYTKTRGGARGTDIAVVGASGGKATRVTQSFPDGGTFAVAAWAPAVPQPPEAAPPAMLRLAMTRIEVRQPVSLLAADGTTALFGSGADSEARQVSRWRPAAKLSNWRVPPSSYAGSRVAVALAVARERSAWLDLDTTIHDDTYLTLRTVGADGRSHSRMLTNWGDRWPQNAGTVAGAGDQLVLNTWPSCDGPPCNSGKGKWSSFSFGKLYRLSGPKLVQLTVGPQALRVEAVDGRRIALVQRSGHVQVLDARGRKIAALNLAGDVVGAAFAGNRLLVLRRGGHLEEWNLTQAGRVRSWQLPVTARLEDADAARAVYVAGGSIHLLELRSGRDRVLWLPDSIAPLHGQLTDAGLFVSYNSEALRAGTVAFVPISRLPH
jgi:hypothetical protein